MQATSTAKAPKDETVHLWLVFQQCHGRGLHRTGTAIPLIQQCHGGRLRCTFDTAVPWQVTSYLYCHTSDTAVPWKKVILYWYCHTSDTAMPWQIILYWYWHSSDTAVPW